MFNLVDVWHRSTKDQHGRFSVALGDVHGVFARAVPHDARPVDRQRRLPRHPRRVRHQPRRRIVDRHHLQHLLRLAARRRRQGRRPGRAPPHLPARALGLRARFADRLACTGARCPGRCSGSPGNRRCPPDPGVARPAAGGLPSGAAHAGGRHVGRHRRARYCERAEPRCVRHLSHRLARRVLDQPADLSRDVHRRPAASWWRRHGSTANTGPTTAVPS